MKLIRWLFWGNRQLIKAENGKWTIHYNRDIDFLYSTATKYVLYEIYFYPKKNRYILECSGYEPKEHTLYPEMVKELNSLNNSLK